MSKKGVSKIVGNSSPKTGVTTLYKVAEWYPATPAASRNEALVTWELFKKRADGKFTTTNIKKKGRGEFTFGSKAHLYTYKVEGYLHSPEGVSPMSMVITPQKNDKQPTAEKNILGIKLTYRDGSAVTKTLSYRDQLRATAKCQNLEGKTLVFTLWEDDENGAGHHVKNQKILQSPPILVDRKGYARWDFTLLTTFIALANKREDDKKQHEYYVTAEYNGKMNASGNVNANNPQFKKPPTAVQPKLKPTPNAPKTSTNPASKHNQPDKKGIIRSIKLADKDGNAFTKKPKFGDTISVIIDARNVKGLSYTLRLWEHDNIGDHDLLYNNTHIFKSDLQRALITLTGKMQKIGEIGNNPKKPDRGEYLTGNYQEIFAEVIFEKVSAKSAVIDVGIMEQPKKEATGISPANIRTTENVKSESTKTVDCYCNRDFTAEEFNRIIHGLRDSEPTVKKDSQYNLFTASNCNIQAEDKTTEKLRGYINSLFKKYEISNCIRKIHFIAQVYHETDRFRTTLEYADGSKYDPGVHKNAIENGNTSKGDGQKYKGRGLMQLTWKNNYKIYKSYSGQDVVVNYQKVSDSLYHACETAGWYWKQGKFLSVGKRWKGPADPPNYVKIQKPDYPKKTIIYTDGSKSVQYGTVDLGLIADDDKVDLISYLVNGGANGLQERRNYVMTLKTIFHYPYLCANKKAPKKVEASTTESVTIRLVRKWQTTKSTIGEFTIDNSEIKGYFLEEKGPDTTLSGKEQRIPIGTYNLEWHSGSKIKRGLKLFNDVVSKGRAILIHAGNTADDTEGCLIAGSTRSVDFVGGSRNKLKEIFDYVEKTGIKNAKIIITQAYE